MRISRKQVLFFYSNISCLSLLFFHVLIFASEPITQFNNTLINKFDNNLSINFFNSSLGYQEFTFTSSSIKTDSVTGSTFGLGLILTNNIGALNSEIGISYSKGKMRYKQPVPYVVGHYQNKFYNYYLQLSYPIKFTRSELYPLINIGHHRWERATDARSNYHFTEYYSHYYWALGLGWKYELTDRLLIDIKGMAGYTFSAELNTPPNPVELLPSQKLKNNPIYMGEIKLYYLLANQLAANAFIKYTQLKYGASHIYRIPGTPFDGFTEPNSKTSQITLGVGLSYLW